MYPGWKNEKKLYRERCFQVVSDMIHRMTAIFCMMINSFACFVKILGPVHAKKGIYGRS